MTTVPPASDAKAKFRILLTTSLVSSLIMLDSNIVAVSLPAIGRSLGASFTDIEWVVSAYLLSYASLLMGAGAYADLKGRKRAMAIGLALFAISSGMCGAATSSWMLNLARAVQGHGEIPPWPLFLLTKSNSPQGVKFFDPNGVYSVNRPP